MIAQVVFPIEGPYAEILLLMEWLIIFFFAQWAIIFLLRVRTLRKEVRILQEKAYIWLLFGFSVMWAFYILSDFFAPDTNWRLVFLNCGYLSHVVGALMFIYILEKHKVFLKQFLFTKFFIALTIVYISVLVFAYEYTQRVSYVFWFSYVVFFLFYMKDIGKKARATTRYSKFRVGFVCLILAFGLMFLGFGLTTDLFIITFGLSIRLLGDILQLFGTFCLSIGFLTIPSMSEFDWQEKIDSLLLLLKSGACIYKKNFRDPHNHIDEDLISSALGSIKYTLQQLTEKDGNSVIEKKGNITLIHPGKYIIGIVICDEKLQSLQILLQNFVEKIERVYRKVLDTWSGNMDIFDPIEQYAKEIFY